MSSTSNRTHPSNRLYNGDVRTLPEAVAAVCAEVKLERDWHRTYVGGMTEPLEQELETLEQRALAAQLLYRHVMDQATAQAVTELRTIGLDDWADALESGDYSGFAV